MRLDGKKSGVYLSIRFYKYFTKTIQKHDIDITQRRLICLWKNINLKERSK